MTKSIINAVGIDHASVSSNASFFSKFSVVVVVGDDGDDEVEEIVSVVCVIGDDDDDDESCTDEVEKSDESSDDENDVGSIVFVDIKDKVDDESGSFEVDEIVCEVSEVNSEILDCKLLWLIIVEAADDERSSSLFCLQYSKGSPRPIDIEHSLAFCTKSSLDCKFLMQSGIYLACSSIINSFQFK